VSGRDLSRRGEHRHGIANTRFYARLTDTRISDGGGVMWVFALPESAGAP